MARLTIRVDFESASIGPGKIALLEQIATTGSIRKAASVLSVSYRQAWLLLKGLEDTFSDPVIETSAGGRRGGGAKLTALGQEIVRRYRTLERKAAAVAKIELTGLESTLRLFSASAKNLGLQRRTLPKRRK